MDGAKDAAVTSVKGLVNTGQTVAEGACSHLETR